MNKDSYYDWIAENDTYPKHSHKFFVALYTKYEGVEGYHRYLGPFDTREEAKVFASNYREKYTKPGFISKVKVFPLCSIVE